jgi:ABC-2 type transport system permease protein
MHTTRERVANSLRICGTIAAKDIVDALKNRTILFNILFVFLIMAVYQWFIPIMYADDGDIVVYAAADSRLFAALENSPDLAPHRVTSIQELKQHMGSDSRGKLGLVAPADFDQRLASAALDAGRQPELGGYVLWSSRAKSDELKSELEARLAELLGQAVRINIEGTVQPQPDSMGPIRMVSATLVLLIVFMATFTVPHLMFEEKQTRTLDALLVSPASIGQVILGKALAGLFYGLTTVVTIFALNWAFVTNWGLTILAVSSGMLLAVGLSLLLGTLFNDRHQMMAWVLIPGQLVLGPVFLSVFDVILPAPLRAAIYWIPTVALVRVFRYSFSTGAPLAQVLLYLVIVVAAAALALSLVIWKVRRSDR